MGKVYYEVGCQNSIEHLEFEETTSKKEANEFYKNWKLEPGENKYIIKYNKSGTFQVIKYEEFKGVVNGK